MEGHAFHLLFCSEPGLYRLAGDIILIVFSTLIPLLAKGKGEKNRYLYIFLRSLPIKKLQRNKIRHVKTTVISREKEASVVS